MPKIIYILCLTIIANSSLFYNKTVPANVETTTNYKAACVMELNSRRVLFAYSSDLRLPMASTTKILTAATILYNGTNLNEEIIIPIEAEGVEGSSVYLKSGDVYSVKDLLYGLMLRSGNDCATALALYHSGSIEDFAIEMNKTAQKAGALSSRFENPHGLPCKNHYTTAKDLALITCYAMKHPIFRLIVGTKYYEPRNWKNKNKLLSLYEWGIGVKTGYTKEAGRCLVSAAEKDGMTLVCTLLNCPNTYEQTITLFNDAYSAYSLFPILKAGQTFILNYADKEIKGYVQQDFYYPLLKEELVLIEIKTIPINHNSKTIKKDEIIGQFEIYLSKRLLFCGNLYKL